MKNLFVFFCLFFFSQIGFAQFEETFNGDLTGWSVNNPNFNWYYSSEGTALSHNWNNRNPIDSDTNNNESGVAVFNGDSLSAAGAEPGIFMLTSDVQGNPIFEKPILSFRQYFKNYQGVAHVDISIDNGTSWTEFPVNQNYGDFMETPENDKVFIDVSSAFPNNFEFQVRFVYEGVGAFWIIDDVRIDNIADLLTPGDMSLSYPETYPPALADSLCLYDYPFFTDSEGGAYIPDEWVILYTEDATEEEKDTMRMMFQITEWETCNCSDLELWKSPIVIEPIKIDLPNSDFPLEAASLPISFPDGFAENPNCDDNTYQFAQAFPVSSCGIENEGFNEHTFDGVDSEMLIMRGGDGTGANNAGFSIPSITLAEDSLYVFSFFARIPQGEPAATADISVAGTVYQSITIDSENDWQRFDIKLDIPIGGSGIIEFTQTNTGVVYAIDDLCVSLYILAESDAIGLNGIDDKIKSCVRAQELDKNYYNFDFLDEIEPTIPALQNPDLPTVTPHDGELVIAVLDTGVDYVTIGGISDIQSHLFYSQENLCYPSTNPDIEPDFYGYDLVDKDSRPYDSHRGGHGTHIISTIIRNMTINQPTNGCDYKIMPVRTHDDLGLGTLFNVTCGISYASERGADYINASWGYYAEDSPVLSAVINQVTEDNDVMIICSAGNDTTNIGIKRAFPSSFTRPNLITVAASNTDNTSPSLAPFSNNNDFLVHYAIQGVDIFADVPAHVTNGNWKDGTSMAAPRLLAMTMLSECHCVQQISDGRQELPYILNEIAFLNGKDIGNTNTRKGRFIDTDFFQNQLTTANCGKIIDNIEGIPIFEDLVIFPNPASNELFIATDVLNNEILEYKVSDITGRIIQTGQLQQNYHSIFLNDFQKGIYFLQIKGEKGIRTVSFIKS